MIEQKPDQLPLILIFILTYLAYTLKEYRMNYQYILNNTTANILIYPYFLCLKN